MRTTLSALLVMGVIITGCNEKVSPDLDNANNATAAGDATPPSNFVFEVVNTAPAVLNYKIHRTGALDTTGKLKECKISSTSALTNPNFIVDNARPDHDDKIYDISCFYEAEEQNLYYNGIDFTVNASKNTCEYVGYAPYSFYQYMPGDSGGTITVVTSPDTVPDCTGSGIGDKNGADIACDQAVDNGLLTAARKSFVYDPKSVCLFDYTEDEGPNCDEGIISVRNVECKSGVCGEVPETKINCGGKAVNCIQGAIKKESALAKYTRGTLSSPTELGVNFTKKHTLPGGWDEGFTSNLHLTNFRRDLANPNIDFEDHVDAVTTYEDRFLAPANLIYKSKYDPRLMDRYASNQSWDGITQNILTSAYNTIHRVYKDPGVPADNLRYVRPLAAEPFMGWDGYRTNPFYIFYCFDAAFDVKARIRMIVRDWDRVHPSAAEQFNWITDISSTDNGIARQDNNFFEIEGDNDGHSEFNDVIDWDDILFMERTAGAAAASTPLLVPNTLWEPSSGFFNSQGFIGKFFIKD